MVSSYTSYRQARDRHSIIYQTNQSHQKTTRELRDPEEKAIQICKQLPQTVPVPSPTASLPSLEDVDDVTCDLVLKSKDINCIFLKTCSVAQNMAKTFSLTPVQCLQSAGSDTASSLDKITSSPFDEVGFNERVDIFPSPKSLVETPIKPSAKAWVSGGQLW